MANWLVTAPLDFIGAIANGVQSVVSGPGTVKATVDVDTGAISKELTLAMKSELSRLVGRSGGMFVRLAGISGAAAVVMGAYGAHAFNSRPDIEADVKRAYDTANRYHLLHSVVLLAVPLCRRPRLSGSLFVLGMLMFSGSCYAFALTGEQRLRKVTPYGGMCLILAWLSMVL